MKEKTTEDFFSNEKYKFVELAYPTFSAKLTINLLTSIKARKFKRVLNKKRIREFKRVINQLHIRHYMHNVLFRGIITPRNLNYSYILARTDENLRAGISSVSSVSSAGMYGFWLSLRSQIELNAHTFYFLKNEAYAQKFIHMKEDREKFKGDPDLVVNILTLIRKFEKEFISYNGLYDIFSTHIHPNPSNVISFSRIKKVEGNKIDMDTNHFFYRDLFNTKEVDEVIGQWIDFFLLITKHFIRLFDDLDNESELDSEKVKSENGAVNYFMDLARRQEVFNLIAKKEKWNNEKYEEEHEKFRKKYTSKEFSENYGIGELKECNLEDDENE